MAGMLYKENKVPHYQRLYQRNDGVRLWMKHPRSKMLFYPYVAMLGFGFASAMYGMGRMVWGKKTMF